MRLLLIADTHVPKRARDLPHRLWDEVARADVVLHAGDWVDAALLDALEAKTDRLVACWGNNDGAELRARLPERADANLNGVRFTVVHETGAAAGREARMAAAVPRHRRAGVRAQSHPVGHHRDDRPPTAQPRVADRPPQATVLHLHDRNRRGR